VIAQFPYSLCAQLLKAQYYPTGDLIDTVFCSNPSATWQSVLHGLELLIVLKKGIIWRIFLKLDHMAYWQWVEGGDLEGSMDSSGAFYESYYKKR
jgi:hypothetical protein